MTSSTVPQSVIDARARMDSHFSSYDSSTTSTGKAWAALWEKGDFLPWDKGFPNPAFEDVLAKRQDRIGEPVVRGADGGIVRRKVALVPGCGRGVDVLLLAEFGYDAVGLEVSEGAVKACEELETKWREAGLAKARNADVGVGRVKFVNGDFLGEKGAWLKDVVFDDGAAVEGFDLIYDYTFFCALRPTFRPTWALRHSQLLLPSKDTSSSHLICLEYPTYKDPKSGGPPFASPPKAYFAHLSKPGEEIAYDEASGHVISEETEAWAGGKGLERVEHFQPERTHPGGRDEQGNVWDWVGIWSLR